MGEGTCSLRAIANVRCLVCSLPKTNMKPRNRKEYPALDRVDADVAAGNLGKAKERLTGLLHAHPHDLSLRPKLAEIYWLMKWPEEAGAYWYLEPNPNEEMLKAIAIFEKGCKHDPLRVLERLKLRVNLEEMADSYAKERISGLREAIRNQGKVMPAFVESRLSTPLKPSAKEKWSFSLFTMGCTVLFIIAVSLILIGVATVGEWIFSK